MPNERRTILCHAVRLRLSCLRPMLFRVLQLSRHDLSGSLWSPIRSSACALNNLHARMFASIPSHPGFDTLTSSSLEDALVERMPLFGDLHQTLRIEDSKQHSVIDVRSFLFYRDDVLCWLLPRPFSSVCFLCLSPIPGLIWFGSVYLVTTAGFVADQLM